MVSLKFDHNITAKASYDQLSYVMNSGEFDVDPSEYAEFENAETAEAVGV